MGSVSVSSCRWCMFDYCMYPVVVHNAPFCITYSWLILVKDARSNHIVESYSRVQVVLSGFSVRLLCFVQEKTRSTYGCMYFFAALVPVGVYVMVMPPAEAMT